MVKKILKFVFTEIVHNGHLQSAGAVSIIYFACFLLNLKVSLDSIVVAYLSFYLIYLYNRYKEAEIDILTNKERTKHIEQINKTIPCILVSTIILISFLLFSYANFWSTVFIFVIIVFGILYTTYFKDITKRIFIFKNIYVSLVFAVLVFYPFIYYQIPVNNLFLSVLVAVFIFLRSIFMQIFLDLKDLEADKQQKLLTLGALMGKDKTLVFLKIFSVSIIVIFILFSLYLSLFSFNILVLMFLVPFDFYAINLVKKNNFFGYILIGGEFILLPILVLISQFFI